jgi:ArsR family transcriptional regulator
MNALFKALNDQTRREIVELLKVKDMTAGEIADHFDISKPSISHHLDLLRQADIVSSIKEGQFIYYSLNATVLDEIISWALGLQKGLNNKKRKNI